MAYGLKLQGLKLKGLKLKGPYRYKLIKAFKRLNPRTIEKLRIKFKYSPLDSS